MDLCDKCEAEVKKRHKDSYWPFFHAPCGTVCGALNLVFILVAPPWLKYDGLGAGL